MAIESSETEDRRENLLALEHQEAEYEQRGRDMTAVADVVSKLALATETGAYDELHKPTVVVQVQALDVQWYGLKGFKDPPDQTL